MLRLRIFMDCPPLPSGYFNGGFVPFKLRRNILSSTENPNMRYKVVLQNSEEGYSVSVPGLPGCWSQGATEEEALENIKDAIRDYLAAVNDLFPAAEVREIDLAV
jgi:predicted RNase H-like HicB family nuclease